MKRLILVFIVSGSFLGFGVSGLSASVIKDGMVLAMGSKCGGEPGYSAPSKCGDEENGMEKPDGSSMDGDDSMMDEGVSVKCGAEEKKPKRPISGSCGEGKCGS